MPGVVAPGSGLEEYPDSWQVSLNKGAANIAKSLMWLQKKLQRLTNELIDLMSMGALASLIAFSLAWPGLIPSGVRVKPW